MASSRTFTAWGDVVTNKNIKRGVQINIPRHLLHLAACSTSTKPVPLVTLRSQAVYLYPLKDCIDSPSRIVEGTGSISLGMTGTAATEDAGGVLRQLGSEETTDESQI